MGWSSSLHHFQCFNFFLKNGYPSKKSVTETIVTWIFQWCERTGWNFVSSPNAKECGSGCDVSLRKNELPIHKMENENLGFSNPTMVSNSNVWRFPLLLFLFPLLRICISCKT